MAMLPLKAIIARMAAVTFRGIRTRFGILATARRRAAVRLVGWLVRGVYRPDCGSSDVAAGAGEEAVCPLGPSPLANSNVAGSLRRSRIHGTCAVEALLHVLSVVENAGYQIGTFFRLNRRRAGDSPQPRSSYWMNAVAPTCSFSTSGAARKVWQMPNMRQCRIGVRTRCQAESQMVGNSDDNFQSDLYRRHVWHVQRASGRSSTLHR